MQLWSEKVPKEIRFKKWTKARHLRPFYIRAHINGKPVTRVLIDRGVVLNVIPYSTVKRLGKSHKNIKETNMSMSNFIGGSTLALRFLVAKLTVWSKTTNMVFFVVDAKPSYAILLDRECIYANQCVPSTLYQQLQF